MKQLGVDKTVPAPTSAGALLVALQPFQQLTGITATRLAMHVAQLAECLVVAPMLLSKVQYHQNPHRCCVYILQLHPHTT